MKQKVFFWLITSGFIAVLLLFSFWAHPLADDYILNYHYKESGFLGLQQWIYNNNTGRYTSSFLGACFAYKKFLYNFYFVPPILLMGLSLLAFNQLILKLNQFFIGKRNKNIGMISIATWLIYIILLPEKSTVFFWFSAAITYTTGTILFIYYITNWLALLSKQEREYKFCKILIPLLLFLTIGTNELIALISFISTISLLFFIKPEIRLKNKSTIIITIILGAMGLLLLFSSPGIHNRVNGTLLTNFLPAFVSTSIWFAIALWYILKLAIIWIVVFLCFLTVKSGLLSYQETFIKTIFKPVKSKQIVLVCLIITIVPLFLILTGSHGSFPLRMLNIECVSITACILLLAFHFGTKQPKNKVKGMLVNIKKYFTGVIAVFIIFTPLSYEIIQTIISGYNYHLADQIVQHKSFETIPANHAIIMHNIDSIRSQIINNNKIYSRSVIKNLAREEPILLFFNPVKPDNSFKYKLDYYGLDSAKVGNQWLINDLKH